MPTGYTAKLVSSGQTFPEFIMGCARAFGALIEMRDSPNDAEIPEKFEASSYHADHIKESTIELERLKNMSQEEVAKVAQQKKRVEVKRAKDSLKETIEQNERITDMVCHVKSWSPPTDEHKELKAFMLNQLEISMNDPKWSEDRLAKALDRSCASFYTEAVSSLVSGINYHETEQEKEVNRTDGRSEWVRQLRLSI